jgi:Raf kinase inhibitor-like YbhB/YbcL family protein
MGKILILFIGAVLVFVLVFLVFKKYSGGRVEETEDININGAIDLTEGMKIKSDVFEEGGVIPAKYTCDGANTSPPLSFAEVPEGTASLALIVEDLDVPESINPSKEWTHWLVWDMPADTTGISEGGTPPGEIGETSGGWLKYDGPCPPDGEHRYFFKLFALDSGFSLDVDPATKEDIKIAMEGHILAEAQLMGKYDRPR